MDVLRRGLQGTSNVGRTSEQIDQHFSCIVENLAESAFPLAFKRLKFVNCVVSGVSNLDGALRPIIREKTTTFRLVNQASVVLVIGDTILQDLLRIASVSWSR